ncbi:MAG: hypothetical protein HY888_06845 [Deltaproteobacteria bacterium]|nr:hypothetical protein [Deltaproteobacteria bacterium]
MRPDPGLCSILARLLVCLFVAGFFSACAATSTTIIEEEVVTNQKPMYTYKSIVIRDFELKRELYTDSDDASMSQRDRRYAQIPGELSEHIERYIKSHRSFREVTRNGEVTPTTLLLKGRFTRLGRFRVSVIVSLHDGASGQEVAYFRQTLWDVLDTTETINNLAREVADFIARIQYK